MRDGFEIFDAHMHYTGIFKEKSQSLIEFMDENGIDKAVVNTLNQEANFAFLQSKDPEYIIKESQNPNFELFRDFREKGQIDHTELEKMSKKYPERIFPFFWYNPNDPNDEDQHKGLKILEEKLKNDYYGVKLQLAMTPCHTKRLIPVSKLLSDLNRPIYIHFNSGLFSTPRTHPLEIIEIAKLLPDLKIVIGHSAHTMEFALEILIASLPYKNIYFETSSSIPYGILTFVKMFGSKRILFESDAPAAGPFKLEYKKIKSLKISDEDKRNIFSTNVTNLLDF